MFVSISKKFKSAILLLTVGLSLLWIIDSSAKELPGQELSTQTKDSLPRVTLKNGSDLDVDGEEASKKQIPVLMFFSMKHCPFCIEVEEDYLKPLLRNSEYDNKVIIRKIRIDGTSVVRDFNGKKHDAEDFGDNYNVSMVPTLILVDSRGKKIVPPIIGITNAHYYSDELDNAIMASTKKIREIAKR